MSIQVLARNTEMDPGNSPTKNYSFGIFHLLSSVRATFS